MTSLSLNSKNLEAFASKECLLSFIPLRLFIHLMTDAVHLDDNPRRQPSEIRNVGADRSLAAEAGAEAVGNDWRYLHISFSPLVEAIRLLRA